MSNLFLSLSDLLLFECSELAVVAGQLFKLVISLCGILLIHAVAIRTVVGESHYFDDDLLKGLLKDTIGDAPLRAFHCGLGLSDGALILVSCNNV